MGTLLHIDSSPLAGSISRELTQEYVNAWKAAHPGGQVIRRDLTANPPPPIDAAWIGAAYTAPGDRTAEQAAAIAFSDELVEELERADEFVIGVAMHNFSVPSVLKLWVDQVVRAGRTFTYDSTGPRGLLQGKKATVVVASGGVYAPGTPLAQFDHVEPFLRTVLGFIGVTEVRFVKAGGTASLKSGSVDRPTFLKPAVEQVHAAAV